jgi:glycosyltransferase involved in cell wall biosynthesis
MARILHIITRLDMGGSAQNTILTCRQLSDKYEIVLVHGLSAESNMTDSEMRAVQKGIGYAEKRSVKFICVPSLVRRISPLKDFRALLSLVWVLLKEKPLIVHTHSSKAGILGRLAAKLAGAPIIIHTPHGHVFYGHFGPLSSKFFLWIEKWFAYFTDRIIVLTKGEKRDYINLHVGRPEQMSTIHSGVDVVCFMSNHINVMEKKRSLGLPSNALIVGFVGWLLPIKGPMVLLRAMSEIWKKHPEIILVLVGKGELDSELRTEVLQLDAISKVKFLGWRDDVDEIMQLIDILVLPSLNEGMGRVLVEAMAAGKPVVASNVGGIPDLVQHDYNGLLVLPGDVKALAASIELLIDDPEKAKLMGQRGRELCPHFSVERMIEKIENLYEELLTSPRPLRTSLCEPRSDKALETRKILRKKPQASDQDENLV